MSKDLINLDSLQNHLDETIPEEVLTDSSTELTLLPDVTKKPLEIVQTSKFEEIEETNFDSHDFNNPIVDYWDDNDG